MSTKKPKQLQPSERAYNYFVRMEKKQRIFRMRDVRRATQWKIGTVEAYRSKKWYWFLFPADRPGYYFCRGLLHHSKEAFVEMHSQKRKLVEPVSPDSDVKPLKMPTIIYVTLPTKIDTRAWIVIVAMLLIRIQEVVRG